MAPCLLSVAPWGHVHVAPFPDKTFGGDTTWPLVCGPIEPATKRWGGAMTAVSLAETIDGTCLIQA